ncbi:MAG: methyltransferase domain-containing protein [Candidatus Bathyarchaeota archaeon]|nr:methyltransferase domain-containing protein [Candidatus Bathyarchaeota archaeon]
MSNIARKKIIRDYYSQRAKDYDRQKQRTWKSSSGFGIDVTRQLLRALRGHTGKRVLEVGVGSGRNALPIMEEIKPWLVGVDLSKEMLKVAKTKTANFAESIDLVLGDADHLPFADNAFDAAVIMSTMHYFGSPPHVLRKLQKTLRRKGVLVYGDVSEHKSDDNEFLETLEKTLSKAHVGYYKPSEMRKLLETSGFNVSKSRTLAYRKSYQALIEDKGCYFGVKPEAFYALVQETDISTRKHYALTSAELTLYYTIIVAAKSNNVPE